MNRITRRIIGTLILFVGAGITLAGGYMALHITEFGQLFAFVPLILTGLAIALAGWSVVTGEHIRDMLRFLFTGIP